MLKYSLHNILGLAPLWVGCLCAILCLVAPVVLPGKIELGNKNLIRAIHIDALLHWFHGSIKMPIWAIVILWHSTAKSKLYIQSRSVAQIILSFQKQLTIFPLLYYLDFTDKHSVLVHIIFLSCNKVAVFSTKLFYLVYIFV